MLSSARRHQRRRSSGVSVEMLSPEPIQSNPAALDPSNISSNQPSPPPPKSYLPSVLTLLQSTHRYSSYVLSGFLGLHALNTCIIPLTTILASEDNALSTIDNGFMITRFLYQPSKSTEIILILAPLGIHVVTGLGLRARRIFQDRHLYGEGILAYYARETRINRAKGLSWPRIRALPTLGYSSTAATGSVLLIFVSLHVFTTRYLPLKYAGDGETSISLVSHALRKHPLLAYTLYSGLIVAGTFHVISGWGRWLKLTFTRRGRRVKNYLVVGTATAWFISLMRVGRLTIFSRAEKGEYDRLYQHLWGAF
jgi:hypothetical protein